MNSTLIISIIMYYYINLSHKVCEKNVLLDEKKTKLTSDSLDPVDY